MLENSQKKATHDFLAIRDSLKSYLYRLTANREDTNDLLQDTFIRVTEKIDLFKGKSSFKTWVFSIATNLARDNRRVQNRWSLDAQDACKEAARTNEKYQHRMKADFEGQTDQQFDIKEHLNYCFTCIAKNLSLDQQIAIVLKEVYAFKRSEIAEIMQLSEGVIKHLLFDGRNNLQERYQQRCSLINKTGACYQCAELNNYFQDAKDAAEKIARLGLTPGLSPEENLDKRFALIRQIDPLNGNGAVLEDTILQILRETIQDS